MTDDAIRVLALDQSPLNTGWAIGEPCDKPAWGTFQLPQWGNEEGMRLSAFAKWLEFKLFNEQITHCFYEDFVDVRGKSFDVSMKQGMQIGQIERSCFEAKVPLKCVPVASWRKRFLGTTKATPGLKGVYEAECLKQKAIRACAMRGLSVNTDHEAEALGILDFGLSTISKKHAGFTDTIFRRSELQSDRSRYIDGGR